VGETSWLFLLIGTFAALGAAMAFGTLVAIMRYHRTGTFPGSDTPGELPAGRLTSLWVRVVIGLVLLAFGIYWIDRAGVL
jgi:hypothetical protein